MAEMIIVDEQNRDDLSRKTGCFLFADTKLWLENDVVHRDDGPAVIFPDGALRWYVRGAEITRAVNGFFIERKWPLDRGLDTPEKLALFREHFLT